MKKIATLFVLTIFVLSIMPLAIAEKEGKDIKEAKVKEFISSGKAKEYMQRKNMREEHKEKREKMRDDLKRELTELKRVCPKDIHDCPQARENYQRFLDRLIGTADNLLERLENVKSRLGEDAPADLKSRLEEIRAKVGNAKEILSSEPTKEEVKRAIEMLKSVKGLGEDLGKYKERKLVNYYNKLIEKTDKVLTLINRFIEQARTDEEKAKLEELKTKITTTVEAIKTAVNENNLERAKALMNNLHDLVSELIRNFAHDRGAGEGRDNSGRGNVVKKELQTPQA